MSVSVVIPCFNEQPSLNQILQVLVKHQLVSEVIVVDDGSSIPLNKFLIHHPKIKLLTHPANLGKSQALKTGLRHVREPIILFLDGDLLNFQLFHVDSLVKPITDGHFDLVLGEFQEPFKPFVAIGQTSLFTGIRCFRRATLGNINSIFCHTGHVFGYLVEAKINQHYFFHYSVTRVKLLGLTQRYKCQKGNLLLGLLQDLHIFWSISQFLTPSVYLRHLSYIRNLKYYQPLEA
jgi:glycosyltransferase involved in cell wall biosynthesis